MSRQSRGMDAHDIKNRAQLLRVKVRDLEADIRELADNAKLVPQEPETGEPHKFVKGEVIAQSMLAVRAAEEVLHRLGRVCQYCDGGTSILAQNDRDAAARATAG